MNRENLNLATNIPLVVMLEETNAKECNSRFHDGVEYRYPVVRMDNGLAGYLYLPVDAHLAIRRARVVPGDEITILKTCRKRIDPNTQLETTAPLYEVKVKGVPEPPPARLAAPAQPQPSRLPPPPPTNGNGHTATALPPEEPNGARMEALVKRCFVVSGRALWGAYLELRTAGCEYDQPTIEDVRAGGISIFIERTRNTGGVR